MTAPPIFCAEHDRYEAQTLWLDHHEFQLAHDAETALWAMQRALAAEAKLTAIRAYCDTNMFMSSGDRDDVLAILDADR